MSNDPRNFDYSQLVNRQWPPTRTPDPEAVADEMRQGPARQVPRDQVAPTLAPPAVPNASRAQTKVWVSHDGKQVRICDMNPHHLQGVMAVLKRAGSIHKMLKIVALLDGGDNVYALGSDVSVKTLMESSWRDHVPQPDMLASMEADWQRRYGSQPWDNRPDDESVTTLRTNIEALIGRLSKPEQVVAVTAAARANRQINI